MPSIRKFAIFVVLINCHTFLNAQNLEYRSPLLQIFQQIESKFNCNFSFKDQDISNHFSNNSSYDTLEGAVDFLQKNTLFEYQILPDKTITVRNKDSLDSFCVKLLNANTGLPFQNVLVRTPYQEIASGSDGLATGMLLSNRDIITISFVGFETISEPASAYQSDSCETIILQPKIEFLNAIKLTNYIAKGISKSANGALTIDYENFDILPGLIEPDVLQTIQALPGIQSVNETVSFINIRGGTNDQNLILWDGIKMYQSGHFFGLISAFNPHLTQKVTVQKNGVSAQYGDGVSGLVDMRSETVLNDRLKAGGGINLISADGYLDLPIGDKASLLIAGRRSINGVYESPTYNSYFEKAFQNTEVLSNSETQTNSDDAFSFFDASARLLYQPSKKDKIRANFLLVGNQLEFLENAEVDGTIQQRKSDLGQDNVSAGLFYERQWSDTWFSQLQLYGSSYRLEATNFDVINDQRLLQRNDVFETGLRINVAHQFNPKLNTSFGYQLNETGVTNFEQLNNPFFQRNDKQVIITQSIFSEVNMRPFSESTNIQAGLRINHIGKFDEILVEPRLSFSQQFLSHFTIELQGEFKSQTTSQIIDFQNDFLGVENRRWVLSRPDDIPILKGRQISFGISFNRLGWLVSAEPYVKKIKGITSQSQGFQNQFQNTRVHGSYTVRGIDLLINKRFKNINTWLSYSYADNTYRFDEFTPQEFQNNIDIRHTLTSGISYSFNNFKVSGGLNWRTGKPTTRPVEGEPIVDEEVNFGAPNQFNIEDYFRVDTSATYEFKLAKKWKAYIGVSIWNLLNTENVLNNFYRVNVSDNIEEINERSLEFTPNLTFRVKF